ncbi:hypothetical protein LJC61_09870, partial [Ruminococcaceae bacterium OttesenSCG-928-A16]|nr:hypothetical protein [Ruminococcaceae bacterium OttesenSCG-928-A16]
CISPSLLWKGRLPSMEMQIYIIHLQPYYDNPVHYQGKWFSLPVSMQEVNNAFGTELAPEDYVIADYDFPVTDLSECGAYF